MTYIACKTDGHKIVTPVSLSQPTAQRYCLCRLAELYKGAYFHKFTPDIMKVIMLIHESGYAAKMIFGDECMEMNDTVLFRKLEFV